MIDRSEYLQSVVRDAVKIKDHGECTNVRVKNQTSDGSTNNGNKTKSVLCPRRTSFKS